jgi:cell division topological specificity factor
MSLFGRPLRRPTSRSAEIARERLRIVIAQEHADQRSPDYLPLLQERILTLVNEYLPVERDRVETRLVRGSEVSTLEINVELPSAEVRTLLEKARGP